MHVKIGDLVMIPGYHPYPRYGRVAQQMEDDQVLLVHVECGDPRCAAEHTHADVVHRAAELQAARAFQPRAEWEEGRLSSPNAVIVEDDS